MNRRGNFTEANERKNSQPQMNTDGHGSEKAGNPIFTEANEDNEEKAFFVSFVAFCENSQSVFICVHPWLNSLSLRIGVHACLFVV
jgi:hypothetical protein